MIKNTLWIGFTLSLLGLVSVSSVSADEWDKKTVLTFSQPVEIPGHVLPAGTYVFKLADSISDRHVVQIFNADQSQVIASLIAISDYRLKATDKTVITFDEVPAGSPEAVRAWFYPGNTHGLEFVYWKSRATQLAKASKAVVPAIAAETASLEELKRLPIVAVTPDEREVAVNAAIQTTPVEEPAATTPMALAGRSSSLSAGTTGVDQTGLSARRSGGELPKTASALPLILMLGLGSIVAAISLMLFGRHATSASV